MKISRLLSPALLMALVVSSACTGSDNNNGRFPDGFADMADIVQVKYVMDNASPDSTARFICLAALGKVNGARIDTLPMATLYAYEHYKDSALNIFSDEYDRFSSSLPLPEKMKILAMAGTVDPQGLGYDLGLHYVDQIREKNMSVAQVEAELKEFEKCCESDPETFTRFMKGFQVVLKLDQGKDLNPEIYKRFAE